MSDANCSVRGVHRGYLNGWGSKKTRRAEFVSAVGVAIRPLWTKRLTGKSEDRPKTLAGSYSETRVLLSVTEIAHFCGNNFDRNISDKNRSISGPKRPQNPLFYLSREQAAAGSRCSTHRIRERRCVTRLKEDCKEIRSVGIEGSKTAMCDKRRCVISRQDSHSGMGGADNGSGWSTAGRGSSFGPLASTL